MLPSYQTAATALAGLPDLDDVDSTQTAAVATRTVAWSTPAAAATSADQMLDITPEEYADLNADLALTDYANRARPLDYFDSGVALIALLTGGLGGYLLGRRKRED
jgi:hypothetical protein